MIEKIRLTWEVVRHVPLRQVLRRIYLLTKRKLTALLPPKSVLVSNRHDQIERLEWSLSGLQSPHGTLEKSNNCWHATFLNVTKTFGSNVEWKNNQDTHRDQLWRMNLHYFEYLPSVEPTIAFQLITDWVECCRPNRPNAYQASWNSYTTSLRLSAWLDYYSKHYKHFNEDFKLQFSASVREQATFLVSNLETDILGNHVVKNIRALSEAAYAFSYDSKTAEWSRATDYWLQNQLKKQILNDGVHFELSPSYHMQVFADFLSIYSIRKSDELNEQLGEILDKMAQVATDLCHPDGSVAQFNDSGLNMTVAVHDCLRVYKSLRQRTVYAQRIFQYPDSGFYGMRTSNCYFIAKLGKLGPDELMAHAHGDWGSFEASFNGKRTIVDQGVFEYVQGRKRDQSRSTENHNTCVFGGHEYAKFIGSFRCAYRPEPSAVNLVLTEDSFQLSGSLTKIPGLGKTIVSRSFQVTSSEIIIHDSSTLGSYLNSSLLFHPDCTVDLLGNGTAEVQHPSHISICSVEPLQAHVTRENACWWPDMGHELKTFRLRQTGTHGSMSTTIRYSKLSVQVE